MRMTKIKEQVTRDMMRNLLHFDKQEPFSGQFLDDNKGELFEYGMGDPEGGLRVNAATDAEGYVGDRHG